MLASRAEPVTLPRVRLAAPRVADLPSRLLFWLLQCGGWAAFIGVMYVWALSYWTPVDAFASKLALLAVGFVLSLAMRAVYRRWRNAHHARLATGALVIIVSFAAAAAWIELQSLLFQVHLNLARNSAGIGLVGIGIGTLLYHGFVMLTWSLLYFGIKAWEDLEWQRGRAERAEAIAHAERVRALQAQLNPHFIFNSLNTVSTLVDENDNAAAKAMIARLATFLRLVLDTLDTPEITIAREIEFVRCYLDIERVRFGSRLQFHIEVEPAAMDALIPTLMLQPLVENAVRHGILSRELGGSVTVRVAVRAETLEIAVLDDGRGNTLSAPARSGIGLSNTAGRLRELYGDAAAITFTATDQGGITALHLPLRTCRDENG